MNNYTNNEPYNPHGFKEQIKIKYEATKAIAGKFLNGTVALTELLTNSQPAYAWAAYCALTAGQQLVWELRANALNQAMLFLMNLKNKTAKKDLCLAYSQGNSTTYPTDIKAMSRYLSTQYPNNKPANQHGGEKEIKRRVMNQNLKTRIIPLAILPAHMLQKLQKLKSLPPLTECLA